tara:strand:+ start:8789 stop:9025 length:237 start_codon:yes stop_codon:yes gene_type:complete
MLKATENNNNQIINELMNESQRIQAEQKACYQAIEEGGNFRTYEERVIALDWERKGIETAMEVVERIDNGTHFILNRN